MPNLKTDRPIGLAGVAIGLNVRRLMYQSLIWRPTLGDETRRLGSSFDAEDLEGLADALVDRVGRNAKLGGNLFGR